MAGNTENPRNAQTYSRITDPLAKRPHEIAPDGPHTRECTGYENLSFGTSLGTQEATNGQAFQLNDDRFRHTAIIGRTGSGKSNLVHQMEREDIRNGAGVFVLAAHEEDALYPLACVPEERLGDVVLLDFSNPAFLPRMNPLDVDASDPLDRDKAVEDALELLTTDNHFDWAGPRFEKMTRDGLSLLLRSPREEDHAIANLARMYVEPEYVKELLKYCTDRHTFDQWVKLFPQAAKSSDNGELVHWFSSKVSRFAHDHTLRHVFGPGHSTVNFADVVDGGKVLIAYVPEDRIGKRAARSICKMLTMRLRDAIMGRASRCSGWTGLNLDLYRGSAQSHEDGLEPFFVYIDEFAKFATNDFEALLAESRKQRVGFVLSFQTLSQTRTLDVRTGTVGSLEQAILGNIGSFICYPMGEPDVRLLADQLDVSATELRWIRRYRPLARLMQGNQPTSAAALAVGLAPEPDNPTAPRRVARSMVTSKTWTTVDGGPVEEYLTALWA